MEGNVSPVVHELTYGTLVVGRFEHPWRVDVYRPKNPQKYASGRVESEIVEKTMAAGPGDKSSRHSTYPTGYDSRCSCCYLNITHTEELHAKEIGGRS